MKRINIYNAFAALAMICVSCGGAKSSEANDVGENTAAPSVSNGVEVVYSSSDAINAPAYEPEAEWGSPILIHNKLTEKGFT